MASTSRTTTVTSPDHHPPTKATVISTFVSAGFTGIAILAVVVLFSHYRVRGRAPVTAAVAGDNDRERRRAGVDIAKLPEFAYTQSARRDGAAAAAVQAPVPRGMHRHVAGVAHDVPSLPGGR
ncbi:hypothetical protein HU200_010084 [Digitaria exilis]|uniref:Uncharacterized protein n=1 Tax=Digitaria exilis TaxID=1010633 RepID=A0A835KQ80_9POAL|nr:hypothetical protein HU200_010084 [Digitaria exilis]